MSVDGQAVLIAFTRTNREKLLTIAAPYISVSADVRKAMEVLECGCRHSKQCFPGPSNQVRPSEPTDVT